MDERTIFSYESARGKIIFSYSGRSFWIDDVEDISAVTADVYTSKGVGQIGETVVSTVIQGRTFGVSGCIFDPLDNNRELLISAVAPGLPGTFTKTDPDGQSWYLDVIPKKTPAIEGGRGVQHFDMTLYAAYPYWRTAESLGEDIIGIVPKFMFPFNTGGTWYLSQRSEEYYKTIINDGNVPASVTVEFSATGAVTGPWILNSASGKRLFLSGLTMLPGEKAVISTLYGSRSVVIYESDGTRRNGYKYLSANSDLSFELMPGNNLITADAEAGRGALSVRVTAPRGVRSGV